MDSFLGDHARDEKDTLDFCIASGWMMSQAWVWASWMMMIPQFMRSQLVQVFWLWGFSCPKFFFFAHQFPFGAGETLVITNPKKKKKKPHFLHNSYLPQNPIHFSHTCPHSCPNTPYISQLPAPITPSISRTILQYLPKRKKGARNEK